MNHKKIFILSTAFIIVILDQFSKFLIKKNFQINESIPIIKNIFNLTYITNTGSAFGLFKGYNIFFILFSAIVIIVIFYFLKKIKKDETKIQFAVSLLLGGTIGNLIDRLLYGSVIDFIDFRIWPVFNLADSSVTIGVVLLIVLLWEN